MDGPTYQTPAGTLPRVSTILDETMEVRDRAVIQGWVEWQAKQGKNDAQKARDRGSLVHELNAIYLRNGIVQYINDEIDSFFIPMLDHLDGFHREELVWVESPIDEGKYSRYQQKQEDGQVTGCLYSESLGYAGCPDILGLYTARKDGKEIFAREMTLCDEKTSADRYSRERPVSPNKKAYTDMNLYNAARVAHRKASKSYKKFWRTCVQLAAYELLVKECLGITPTQHIILIGVPGSAQRFILRHEEKEKAKTEWLERLAKYKSISNESISQLAETTQSM